MSIVRILLTVVIVVTFTLVTWIVAGMAAIILTNGQLPQPAGSILAAVLTVAAVVLGVVVSMKIFGGKPRK